MAKKFVSTDRKGFTMTFANGLIASVQWGKGNYCQNYYKAEQAMHCDGAMCDTAEVSVWKENGDWLNACNFVTDDVSGYDVCGHMTPEQVVEFLHNVATATL